LAKDLADPEFLRDYVVESMRIATIDRLVNALDQAREAAGLSKAELAWAIGAEPAAIRRLFGSGHSNPTLGTLAEVASALGMQVTLTLQRCFLRGSGGTSPSRSWRGAWRTLAP